MAKEVYRIEIPISAEDQYSVKVDKAEKKVTKFEKSISRMERRLRRRQELVIGVKDRATAIMTRIDRLANGLIRGSYRLTIKAIDGATRTIGAIKRGIFSIPALITVGLSVVGVDKLKDATVGAAMNWEQYEVSMTHWLDGNIKKAKELTKWMGEFADITPYSSPELFPALTKAVSITNKDLDKSKRLLRIASDMAALTPGRDPVDAMQALANARMGNTVMLEAYGIDITKKQMDKMGGWEKLIDRMEKTFGGGAEKLSKTAAGVLATLKGYRGSLMRSIGTGILEPMKPRLDAINQWLAENQETWGRWKNVVYRHGKEASEWLFSNLENAFSFIRSHYLDNDDFMKLDFKGKVEFIWDDIKGVFSSKIQPELEEWWSSTGKPWAVAVGVELLGLIAKGAWEGMKNGFSVLVDMHKKAFTEEGNLLGTALADAILLILGVKLVSGIAKIVRGAVAIGRGAINVGRWGKGALNWGRTRKQQKEIRKRIKRNDRRGVNQLPFDEQMKRMSGNYDKNKEKSRRKSIHTPTWNTRQTTTPSKRWWQKLWPFGGKGAGVLKTGSRRIPILGSLLSAFDIFTSKGVSGKSKAIGGTIGGIAGGAAGTLLGPLGTVGGAAAGGWLGNKVGGWIGKAIETVFGKKGEHVSSGIKSSMPSIMNPMSMMPMAMPMPGMPVNPMTMMANQMNMIGLADEMYELQGDPMWIDTEMQRAAHSFQSLTHWTANLVASIAGDGLKLTTNIGRASHSFDSLTYYTAHAVVGVVNDSMQLSNNMNLASRSFQSGALAVKSALDNLASRINSVQAPSFSASSPTPSSNRKFPTFFPFKKYAKGGYIDQPHLGLVGEAGPEMIIPLSSGRRNRALDLYMRTGQMLGVRPYADGGMVGREPVPMSVPQGQGESTSVYIGDIKSEVNVTVQGDSGKIDSKGLAKEIADDVAMEIVRRAKEIASNMPMVAQ